VNDDEQTTKIHVLSGIRTHCLSVQAINAFCREATGNGADELKDAESAAADL
jgi:hypothetical protein